MTENIGISSHCLHLYTTYTDHEHPTIILLLFFYLKQYQLIMSTIKSTYFPLK